MLWYGFSKYQNRAGRRRHEQDGPDSLLPDIPRVSIATLVINILLTHNRLIIGSVSSSLSTGLLLTNYTRRRRLLDRFGVLEDLVQRWKWSTMAVESQSLMMGYKSA